MKKIHVGFKKLETKLSTLSSDTSRSIAKGRPWLLFATLMLGMMAQGLTFTAFVSALPQMAHDLGSRGEFVAQMTMALAALGLMLGALASGSVLERLGTRVTLLVSLLIYGLSGAGGMILPDPTLLLTSRFVVGFAVACMVTTCVWGIAAEYKGARRARALGLSSSLSNVSALTGTLLGGYLAHIGGWPLAFVQYLVFGVVAFLLAFASIRQVKPEPDSAAKAGQPYFKRLLPFYLLTALLFAVLFMASTQFAFLLEENGVRDPATRSLILGTTTVVGALIAFLYGPLQQRLSALGTFLLGLICMAVALAVSGWGIGVHPAFAVFSAGLMGIYAGVVLPYVYHAVTELTDDHSRGRAIGLLTAFGFLGGFLNPPIFVTLSEAIGLRNAFLVMAVVMAVLALGAATNLFRRRGALRARVTLM